VHGMKFSFTRHRARLYNVHIMPRGIMIAPHKLEHWPNVEVGANEPNL